MPVVRLKVVERREDSKFFYCGFVFLDFEDVAGI